MSYKVITAMIAVAMVMGGLIGSAYALLNTPLFEEKPITNNNNQGTTMEIPPSDGVDLPDVDDDSVNFLLLGIDKSEHLTDTIMIANLDVENQRINILQVPRDTYVGDERVPTGKINAVYGFPDEGQTQIASLISVINDAFKLSIDHYATIDLDAFVEVVDILGGVEIDIQQEIYYAEGMVIPAGKQVLNGQQAEWFVRHRKGYYNADIGRMGAQKQFMEALFKMMLEASTSNVISMATTCVDKITTDMTLMDMLGYYNAIRGISQENIEFYTVPGDGVSSAYNGYSTYGVAVEELAEILNEHFRPNTGDVPSSDLNLTDVESMKAVEYQRSQVVGSTQTEEPPEDMDEEGWYVVVPEVTGGDDYYGEEGTGDYVQPQGNDTSGFYDNPRNDDDGFVGSYDD